MSRCLPKLTTLFLLFDKISNPYQIRQFRVYPFDNFLQLFKVLRIHDYKF